MMVDAMAKSKRQKEIAESMTRSKYDTADLSSLYERYYERIYRFCVHRLYCSESAEDVTSSVFLAVASKLTDFKGETEDDFKNWLYAIAANMSNSHIRKSLRHRDLLKKNATIIADTNEDVRSKKDNWPEVYSAISTLKPLSQTIITLRYFENFTHEQIAQVVDKKPSTVRVILHRSLKALKKNLKTVSSGVYNG